jgi:hypothetical protein
MRSSDAWLGVPYDIFNFSVVTAYVAWLYNERMKFVPKRCVTLGTLHLTMVSSHLYAENAERAEECAAWIAGHTSYRVPQTWFPEPMLFRSEGWDAIYHALVHCRDRTDELSVWEIRPPKYEPGINVL